MAPPGRDWTLAGLGEPRVHAVAAGEAEFAITMVPYLLVAQARAAATLPVRFVATFHQRSPIAAIVLAGSPITSVDQLGGRTVAGHPYGWFIKEYEAALARLGLDPPVVVDRPERNYGAVALADGDVEVVPTLADTLSVVRRRAAAELRVIPFDIPVYGSGLVASDRVPHDVATRMVLALAEAFEQQRIDPAPGADAFGRRFPDIAREDIDAGWQVFEPYAFDGVPAGAMHAGRWDATIRYAAATHGLPVLSAERVYRPELLLTGVGARP